MTEAHGDSVVIYRSAVIHGFVLRKSLFFPGFLRCGTWRLRVSPEHTGINILFLCRVPAGRPLFII